ncbi:uncharacterized protein FMAN_15255 [Fusarium mangiferae]|uniref:Uncharacterized protein n=1 Tax=Fusarium mangiferae TaxID=192010 RepID=A0A1L7UIV8_FUSMA|nr:uncharacterized protein FMAN_15255 [Fusarium mangiferae]CVL07086.1 uncharacterized protein FMAN_15255 [Fusarium mangiferae]
MSNRIASHLAQLGNYFKSQLDQALGLTDNCLSELTDRLDLEPPFFDACEYLPDNEYDAGTDQTQPPSKTRHELGHLARQFSYVLRLIQVQDKDLYGNILLWMQCFSVDLEFIHQLGYLGDSRQQCSGPLKEWDIKKVRLWLRDTLSEFYEVSLSNDVLEAIQQKEVASHQPAAVDTEASNASGLREGSREYPYRDGYICELADTSAQPEAIYADAIVLSPISYFPDSTVAELPADSIHAQGVPSESRNAEEPVLIQLTRCRYRISID